MTDMIDVIDVAGLAVDAELYHFVNDEVLRDLAIEPDALWRGLADLVAEFAPRHRALLAERQRLQHLIDRWHRDHQRSAFDPSEYRQFLESIGYIVPPGPPFTVDTTGVDREVSEIAGPQLVVPVSNARYALNAANARWGSLYDALYGTDAMGSLPPPGGYDPTRGAEVIAWARRFLDEVTPLAHGSHADVVAYSVTDHGLAAELADGMTTALRDPNTLVGYRGEADQPSAVLLEHHALGIELVIDRAHPVDRRARFCPTSLGLELLVQRLQLLERFALPVFLRQQLGEDEPDVVLVGVEGGELLQRAERFIGHAEFLHAIGILEEVLPRVALESLPGADPGQLVVDRGAPGRLAQDLAAERDGIVQVAALGVHVDGALVIA